MEYLLSFFSEVLVQHRYSFVGIHDPLVSGSDADNPEVRYQAILVLFRALQSVYVPLECDQ